MYFVFSHDNNPSNLYTHRKLFYNKYMRSSSPSNKFNTNNVHKKIYTNCIPFESYSKSVDDTSRQRQTSS